MTFEKNTQNVLQNPPTKLKPSCAECYQEESRDRDIANVLYFHDNPTLQSTGKAYGMAMKCSVKGLWENILVATALGFFFRI